MKNKIIKKVIMIIIMFLVFLVIGENNKISTVNASDRKEYYVHDSKTGTFEKISEDEIENYANNNYYHNDVKKRNFIKIYRLDKKTGTYKELISNTTGTIEELSIDENVNKSILMIIVLILKCIAIYLTGILIAKISDDIDYIEYDGSIKIIGFSFIAIVLML